MLQLLSSNHAFIMQAVDHWAAGTTQPLSKPPLTQHQFRKLSTQLLSWLMQALELV